MRIFARFKGKTGGEMFGTLAGGAQQYSVLYGASGEGLQ